MNTTRIIIDPEFKALIPPLTADERAGLEKSMLAEGCRNPLVTWLDVNHPSAPQRLLDGHTRREICGKFNIPYDTVEVDLLDRDAAIRWIILNQFSRRNLTTFQRAELALKLEPGIKQKAKEHQIKGGKVKLPQKSAEASDEKESRNQIAKAAGVSHDTIHKAKVISEKASEPVKVALREGKATINAAYNNIVKDAKRKERKKVFVVDSNHKLVKTLDELIDSGQKFSTIYADPPWPYDNQATRASTDNHYSTMTLEQIAALPISKLASENAHLHLWTTNAFIFDCKAIIEAWGFTYKSCLVWCKKQMGIGNYWRVSHEFLLLGIRGSAPFQAKDEMSWVLESRCKHSAKPEIFRQKIEKVSPGPYLELFARRTAPGWVSWGNEIDKDLFNEEAFGKE